MRSVEEQNMLAKYLERFFKEVYTNLRKILQEKIILFIQKQKIFTLKLSLTMQKFFAQNFEDRDNILLAFMQKLACLIIVMSCTLREP